MAANASTIGGGPDLCVSIYGYTGPDDKFNLHLDPYEWYVLKTEYARRAARPPGYVVEIMDTDGDEYFFDLHGISCLWKRSPNFGF